MTVLKILESFPVIDNVDSAIRKMFGSASVLLTVEDAIRLRDKDRVVLIVITESQIISDTLVNTLFSETRAYFLVACVNANEMTKTLNMFPSIDFDFITSSASLEEWSARIGKAKRWLLQESEKPTIGRSLPTWEGLQRADVLTWIKRRISLPLTEMELSILEVLVENLGQCVQRAALYERVWGVSPSPWDRRLDIRISTLRRKLKSSKSQLPTIRAVRNVGYKLTRE
jgi:DNA-binding response OmpR family regulator